MIASASSRHAPAEMRGSAQGELDIRVHRSIEEIAPDVWDALVEPDDLQATHRFVLACERARVENATYRHVLVTRQGAPQAIASFSSFRVGLDVLATGLTRRMLAVARRLWPNALRVPVVFGGLPVSFGRSCLRIAPSADVPAVLAALVSVADDFAASVRAPVICFKEFGAAESARLSSLSHLGLLRVPSLPGCRLELPWRSPSEWIDAMRAPYRRQLLASERTASDHRLRARRALDWRADAGRIHALYDQVIERAEFKLERLPATFFEQMAGLSESCAILLERDESLLAAAIVLDGPTESTSLLVGMDYAVARECGAYHAIVEQVVRHAITRGARAVELGQTSYDYKTRLGGVATSRDLLVRGTSPFVHRMLAMFSGALFPTTGVRARRVFRDSER